MSDVLTVAQLIQELTEMPQDAKVFFVEGTVPVTGAFDTEGFVVLSSPAYDKFVEKQRKNAKH